MESSLVICLLIFNVGWIGANVKEELIIAGSEAQCLKEAGKLDYGKMVMRWPTFSYPNPEELCGVGLKDCRDVRNKEEAK